MEAVSDAEALLTPSERYRRLARVTDYRPGRDSCGCQRTASSSTAKQGSSRPQTVQRPAFLARSTKPRAPLRTELPSTALGRPFAGRRGVGRGRVRGALGGLPTHCPTPSSRRSNASRIAWRSASRRQRPKSYQPPLWWRAQFLPRRRTAAAHGSAPSSPCFCSTGRPHGKARLLLADEVGSRQDYFLPAGGQCHDLGPAGRRSGACSLSIDADVSVAGGVNGQARYSECGVVIDE